MTACCFKGRVGAATFQATGRRGATAPCPALLLLQVAAAARTAAHGWLAHGWLAHSWLLMLCILPPPPAACSYAKEVDGVREVVANDLDPSGGLPLLMLHHADTCLLLHAHL